MHPGVPFEWTVTFLSMPGCVHGAAAGPIRSGPLPLSRRPGEEEAQSGRGWVSSVSQTRRGMVSTLYTGCCVIETSSQNRHPTKPRCWREGQTWPLQAGER
ncbi:hypothetical protein B0T26DRAFT_298006 [Lasiosphaeria miniovina]|uniref:Uncharacterized protein n=1 Tax=Lasiosphaeria miniovina TaxID=1954250 RepID=A0AA40DV46_9PEZI|nr:uncharacterized protein B0T26DRAFT_298006 [Lasiosphaeria miniovina]KAK0717499.1 hypothetical protein B0T26DRAFT_298006 [Lasiosphaeria miniovina]